MHLALFVELAKMRPAVRQKEMVVVLEINTALFGRRYPPAAFGQTLVPRLVRSMDIVHAIAKVGSEPALTTQLSIQFMPAIWTRPARYDLTPFHAAILPSVLGP